MQATPEVPQRWPQRAAWAALLALPGALIVYTGFNAGGYFAGTQALLVIVVALVLVLRVTLAEQPFAGASISLGVAAGAMTLLAGWTLLSASWSHAPARALIEFDRSLLYVLVLLLFGTLAMTTARLAWIVRALAAASVIVCGAGLVSRTLPHVWPVAPDISPERLTYPVTYWNALGLLGALGAILCMHIACSEREPGWTRVAGAAALPILGSTVYLTLSRGAIGVAVIGLLAYLLLGRPRAVVGGLLATLPATAIAVGAVYHAAALTSRAPTGAAGVSQGRHAALVVGLCVLGAAVARLALLALDARIVRLQPAPRLVRGVAGAAALVVVALVIGFNLPGRVSHQYELFKSGSVRHADLRQRLTDPGNNGRLAQWRVSSRTFAGARLKGTGAGTYQILWNRRRTYRAQVFDGHSLYLETLAEMGIAGLVLVAAALLTLLAGVARRMRGPDRALYAALFAVMIAWAIRAGVDWDWEMPVLTLWIFILGGAALATAPHRAANDPAASGSRGPRPNRAVRVLIGVGCLVLAITPARMVVSQRHLDASVRAFDRGDCPAAIHASLDAIDALAVRPEPYEILGWCDVRIGQPGLAVRAMNAAIHRDPRNWEFHYGLALARGAASRDPLGEARAAARLNPLEPLAAKAVENFRTRDPRLWRARALQSKLPPT